MNPNRLGIASWDALQHPLGAHLEQFDNDNNLAGKLIVTVRQCLFIVLSRLLRTSAQPSVNMTAYYGLPFLVINYPGLLDSVMHSTCVPTQKDNKIFHCVSPAWNMGHRNVEGSLACAEE